jgi:hypothetical protein
MDRVGLPHEEALAGEGSSHRIRVLGTLSELLGKSALIKVPDRHNLRVQLRADGKEPAPIPIRLISVFSATVGRCSRSDSSDSAGALLG